MLQLRARRYDPEFEYPFTISKGTKTHQPTLVTALSTGRFTGFGEAPAIHYYNVTVEGMMELLESKRGVIERYALIDPRRFWHFLHHLIPGAHFLTAALDIAGWDLFARMRGLPLHCVLGIEWTDNVPSTDYTLGIDTPERMLEKMQAHPWPLYKIKIGAPEGIDTLRFLRQHTTARFRVDANESLTYEDTLKLLPELHALGVDLVEQPLPRGEGEAMAALKAQSPVDLFADESCVTEADVAGCAKGFHGINIKLTKCGGITPALRMIEEARGLGLKVMIGSMNETSLGTAAVAHLLPLLDAVDADGPLLLKQDLASGLRFDQGRIVLPEGPGTGVVFTGLADRPATH